MKNLCLVKANDFLFESSQSEVVCKTYGQSKAALPLMKSFSRHQTPISPCLIHDASCHFFCASDWSLIVLGKKMFNMRFLRLIEMDKLFHFYLRSYVAGGSQNQIVLSSPCVIRVLLLLKRFGRDLLSFSCTKSNYLI